jgi:signal transduction histidine kinase
VELAPTDVRTLLENVLDALEPTAQAKHIALRLQQVLWNVLNNAVKFTPANGLITVKMRCDDGWIEMSVTDTGKGIAADFLPHVFESFRQEEGRMVRAEGGLGLGMSITRQLVELHGGTIAATSPGPGRGSTFTIRLPALVCAPQEPQSQAV